MIIFIERRLIYYILVISTICSIFDKIMDNNTQNVQKIKMKEAKKIIDDK